MTTQVIKVGRQSVAIGLKWVGLAEQEPDAARAEVAVLMERNRSKFAASLTYGSGHTLVGFVSPDAPKAATKVPSAAAWAAQAVTEPTLIIQPVGLGKYWYLYASPGEVDPSTDRVVSSEDIGPTVDELLGRLMREVMDAADANVRIVATDGRGGIPPVSMLVDEAMPWEQGDLAHVLKGTKPGKQARITQLAGITPMAVVAIVAVVLGIVGAISHHYIDKHFAEKRALEEVKQRLAQEQAEAARIATLTEARIKEAVIKALAEDSAIVPIKSVVDACVSAWGEVSHVQAGWDLRDISCSAGSGNAMTLWGRSNTVPADYVGLHTSIGKRGIKPSFAPGGEAVVPLDVEPGEPRVGYKRLDELTQHHDWLVRIGTWLQRYEKAAGVNVTVSQPATRSITYIDPASEGSGQITHVEVPADQTYRTGTLRFQGDNFWSLSALTGLVAPEVSVKSIKLNHQGDGSVSWEAQGTYIVAIN